MARVKGREVVIDLMDAVAKLEATAMKHAGLLESIASHAITTSVELTALSGEMRNVSQRVTSLESEFHGMARGFVQSAKLSRTTQDDLSRVARLLGELAGGNKTRFDEIEGRLDRLEKKTG